MTTFPFIDYEWRFVEEDFSGFADRRSFTRFQIGDFGVIDESPEGSVAPIPRFIFDAIAHELEKRQSEWKRTLARPTLIRYRLDS